uniref:CS domain-containing protein n=1 Tax=Noctiluca scintillans TaxID=2966 RepID=A0A7S1AJ00_NOCSC
MAEEDGVLIEEVSPSGVSAYEASKLMHKDNSYYFAHGKREELPEGTVVRTGDPLGFADGLGPHQLESQLVNIENVRWIDGYSWGDEGKVVKMYIEFPGSVKGANVDCTFTRFGVDLLVPGVQTYGVRIRPGDDWVLEHERKNGFAHEIVPEACKYRVSSNGQRITLTLAKKDEKETWCELKKKDIRADLRK